MTTSKITDRNTMTLLADLPGSFDHAPWAVTELSGEAHIVRYANPAFCQLINKARDEVIGKRFETLLTPAESVVAHLDRVFHTGAAVSYTAEGTGDAVPLLYSYHLWPVRADGRTAGVIIQVNETGPLHATRQAISQALLLGALRQDELIEAADAANVELQTEIKVRKQRENDAKLLTNELAHRVKNNLAVIAALISNEIRRAPEPCVQGYRAMQDRIMAIALLYDLMSQSSQDRTIALAPYLTGIAKSLSTSLLGTTSGIRIAVDAEDLYIDSERVLPFGLLVNELSTNAVKHAFPGGTGLLTLAVRRIGSDFELNVSDDGVGMETQVQDHKPGRHGSDYITIFVRQLQGTLVTTTASGGGTTHSIRFPLSPHQDAPSSP